jgi:hypothetical protein
MDTTVACVVVPGNEEIRIDYEISSSKVSASEQETPTLINLGMGAVTSEVEDDFRPKQRCLPLLCAGESTLQDVVPVSVRPGTAVILSLSDVSLDVDVDRRTYAARLGLQKGPLAGWKTCN